MIPPGWKLGRVFKKKLGMKHGLKIYIDPDEKTVEFETTESSINEIQSAIVGVCMTNKIALEIIETAYKNIQILKIWRGESNEKETNTTTADN